MKREELLKKTITEENKIDVSAIIKKDIKFLKREARKVEDQIEDLEESIETHLANPELSIDTEFLTKLHDKEMLETYLKNLKKASAYVN